MDPTLSPLEKAATPLRIMTAALCVLALAIFAPFALPLILAAWFADILQPVVARLERLLRSRARAASALVLLVLLGTLGVVGVLILVIGAGAKDFVTQVRAAMEGEGTLANALLGGGTEGAPAQRDWAELASRYGANGWRAVTMLAQASTTAVVGLMVFLFALYTFVVDGTRLRGWLEDNAPIPVSSFTRLAGAFRETGRGLLIASGGTSLVQGVVATVAYAAIGIPRALVLGPLTAVCSMVPFVGTALVWGPLAVELWLTGQHGRAIATGLVGIVISTIDNIIRPVLARYGRLQLPMFAVLLSILGGLTLFGAVGALLGPLFVRLCVEGLAILSGARRTEASSEGLEGGSHDLDKAP